MTGSPKITEIQRPSENILELTINIYKLLCKGGVHTVRHLSSHLVTAYLPFSNYQTSTKLHGLPRLALPHPENSREPTITSNVFASNWRNERRVHKSSNCTINNPVCFSERLKAPQATPPRNKGTVGREEWKGASVFWDPKSDPVEKSPSAVCRTLIKSSGSEVHAHSQLH